MDLLDDNQVKGHIKARFRPTAERLNEINRLGQQLLDGSFDADLEAFTNESNDIRT
jgi:hypothetical protein